jgi:hypothetical protein
MTMFLEVKFEIGYFITTGIFTNCEYTRTALGSRTTVLIYKYYIIIGNETVTTKSQRVERKKSLVLKS